MFKRLLLIATLLIPNVAFALGDINLTWERPFLREDNTALTVDEIAGYRIYYGLTSGDYQNQINITDGTVEAYSMIDVPFGDYYLVVTTIDTEGRESSYSTEVNATIDDDVPIVVRKIYLR